MGPAFSGVETHVVLALFRRSGRRYNRSIIGSPFPSAAVESLETERGRKTRLSSSLVADISRLGHLLGNPKSSTSRQSDELTSESVKKIDCQLRAVIDPIRSDNTKEEREVR